MTRDLNRGTIITAETLGRLDRNRVTMRLILGELTMRAVRAGDTEVLALVGRLAAVSSETGSLLEAVLEAVSEEA